MSYRVAGLLMQTYLGMRRSCEEDLAREELRFLDQSILFSGPHAQMLHNFLAYVSTSSWMASNVPTSSVLFTFSNVHVA
jgi:hypothetical protein